MTDSEYRRVRRMALDIGHVLRAGRCADYDAINLHDVIFGRLLPKVDEHDDLCHLDAVDVSDVSYEVASRLAVES